MHIVAQFLREVLDREIHDEVFREDAHFLGIPVITAARGKATGALSSCR